MLAPKFSIVIPTYNRAELLVKTIESFLEQSYSNFEIIVIDDGGTDNTESILTNIHDSRLQYFKVSNRERGAARNFGAKKAKGAYINFFDSDDLAYPNHLEIAESIIDKNPNHELFALSYELLKPNNEIIKKVELSSPVESFICEGNHLSCNGVFIKREIALNNPFSEIRALSASEDYELWLRLAARFEFPCYPYISHAVIHHEGRSTLNFDPTPLIKRKEIMLNSAFEDQMVSDKFESSKDLLYATTYSYIALHIALSGKQKITAIKWWLKGIKQCPKIAFQKRSFATIKHILIS